jgi:hypothetical protein
MSYEAFQNDLVDHPQHYQKHAIKLEPLDLCEELPFCLGNVMKYCFRYKDKGMPELDLKKALFYLDRQMEKTGQVFFLNQHSEKAGYVAGLYALKDNSFCKALLNNDLMELREVILNCLDEVLESAKDSDNENKNS